MAVIINASTSTGLVQSADTSGQIELQTNGTTVATVNTSNNVQFRSSISVGNATPTTSGAGITFPATQSASTDANTLDDYEEGTWTPIIGGDGGESGQSYSGQTGNYTKVGRVVTVTFRVALSTKGTITGNVVIKGLPFTIQNSITFGGGVSYWDNLAVNWSYIFLTPSSNSTYATVYGTKTAGTTSISAATADIGNTSQFNGSFTYFV